MTDAWNIGQFNFSYIRQIGLLPFDDLHEGSESPITSTLWDQNSFHFIHVLSLYGYEGLRGLLGKMRYVENGPETNRPSNECGLKINIWDKYGLNIFTIACYLLLYFYKIINVWSIVKQV